MTLGYKNSTYGFQCYTHVNNSIQHPAGSVAVLKSAVFQNKNDITAAPTAFSLASPEGKSSFPFLKTFWADKTVTCPRRTEHWNMNKTRFSCSLENPGHYQGASILTWLANFPTRTRN